MLHPLVRRYGAVEIMRAGWVALGYPATLSTSESERMKIEREVLYGSAE